MSPFGEEPQAPPSAADPLAAPFGDEPPAPPDDELNARPSTDDSFLHRPEQNAPSSNSTSPPFDSTEPPAMPDEDPFKDDPEPGAPPAPESGASVGDADRAVHESLAETRQIQPSPNFAPAVAVGNVSSRPRLLQANGESIVPTMLPDRSAGETNPLRQLIHPVQKSAFKAETGTATAVIPKPESDVWQRNPLRAH